MIDYNQKLTLLKHKLFINEYIYLYLYNSLIAKDNQELNIINDTIDILYNVYKLSSNDNKIFDISDDLEFFDIGDDKERYEKLNRNVFEKPGIIEKINHIKILQNDKQLIDKKYKKYYDKLTISKDTYYKKMLVSNDEANAYRNFIEYLINDIDQYIKNCKELKKFYSRRGGPSNSGLNYVCYVPPASCRSIKPNKTNVFQSGYLNSEEGKHDLYNDIFYILHDMYNFNILLEYGPLD